MDYNISEQRKLNDPYFKIMELRSDDLQSKLNSWTRSELIEWLCWNDSNGVYKDEDSLREFDNILEKEEAIEIIAKQITEG
jgi:hypothetical protein